MSKRVAAAVLSFIVAFAGAWTWGEPISKQRNKQWQDTFVMASSGSPLAQLRNLSAEQLLAIGATVRRKSGKNETSDATGAINGEMNKKRQHIAAGTAAALWGRVSSAPVT